MKINKMGTVVSKLSIFIAHQVLEANTDEERRQVIFSVSRITELEIELAQTKKVKNKEKGSSFFQKLKQSYAENADLQTEITILKLPVKRKEKPQEGFYWDYEDEFLQL